MTDAEMTVVPDDGVPDENPLRLIGGTFAIYVNSDGKGGLVLITDIEGRGIERHPIPAAMVKMMTGNSPVAKMIQRTFNAFGAPPA